MPLPVSKLCISSICTLALHNFPFVGVSNVELNCLYSVSGPSNFVSIYEVNLKPDCDTEDFVPNDCAGYSGLDICNLFKLVDDRNYLPCKIVDDMEQMNINGESIFFL